MKAFIFFILLLIPAITLGEELQIPKGYTLQIMEPLGGKIAKPNGWFYKQVNDGMWIISKENPDKGSYITGMKIVAIEPKKSFNLTGEAWARGLIVLKKNDPNVQILSICAENKQGPFESVCLETIEKINGQFFHLQYTVFWLNDADIAFTTTFSAPANEWEVAVKYYNVMSRFQLVDMEHLKANNIH